MPLRIALYGCRRRVARWLPGPGRGEGQVGPGPIGSSRRRGVRAGASRPAIPAAIQRPPCRPHISRGRRRFARGLSPVRRTLATPLHAPGPVRCVLRTDQFRPATVSRLTRDSAIGRMPATAPFTRGVAPSCCAKASRGRRSPIYGIPCLIAASHGSRAAQPIEATAGPRATSAALSN